MVGPIRPASFLSLSAKPWVLIPGLALTASGKDKGKAKAAVMLSMRINDCQLAELLTPPEAIEHLKNQLLELDKKRLGVGVVRAGTREFSMRLSDGRSASFAETSVHC